VLAFKKNSLQPVVVWSQDASFLQIWVQNSKKNLPGTNGVQAFYSQPKVVYPSKKFTACDLLLQIF
jgi:hypothetical protein